MTTELQELYRTIGQQHCRLGQSYLALADLHAQVAHDPGETVYIVSAVVGDVNAEPASSTVQTEVRPPEMAVHAPSTVPPHVHENGSCSHCDTVPTTSVQAAALVSELAEAWRYARTAAFAPDAGTHTPASDDAPQSNQYTHPQTVARQGPPDAVSDDVPPVEPIAPLSNIGGRKKTDMTAAQWANGLHFKKYVMRTEPFKSWTAEQQNAKRDEFVAAQPPDEIMNRWGQRFAKFCGVVP